MKGKKSTSLEMLNVYSEFGIDIHELNYSLQTSLNELIKELIKERKKNTHER